MSRGLSKSRFQTGLQCRKALWLKCHAPGLADAVSELQQHIFDTGTAVGELARERFEGGVLVAEDHLHSAQALETTAHLLKDPPPALFEAALRHGGVFVRPDVIVRAEDGCWDLYEVKSTNRLKDEHVSDVAVQMWVLEGAGLRIRRAYLMHLNGAYVHDGGQYDLQALFTVEDVTDRARAWQPEIPTLVADMLNVLEGPEPELRIGRHCDRPYQCAFHAYCHRFLPEMPVTALPRISSELLDALLQAGIHSIADVPPDLGALDRTQRTVCRLVRDGKAYVAGDLPRTLAALDWPLHFLDFETLQSALPVLPGTTPWQQVPFQWSCHVLHADGRLEHREFLHEAGGDPRPAFMKALLGALEGTGSVLVYSSYENRILRELARDFPGDAAGIAAVQARLVDLERVVRTHLRHPACLGRTSIKVVLPALVPDMSYEGLAIGDGKAASFRFWEAATGRLDEAERAVVYRDLREYCGMDTLAMARVLAALQELAGADRPAPGEAAPAGSA